MTTQFGICQVAIAPIRANASDTSEIVTQLLFGDYVKVIEQGEPWVKVDFPSDDYEGYMDFKQLHSISKNTFEIGISVQHEVVKQGLLKVKGPLGIQHLIFGSNLPFLQGNQFKIGDIICELLEKPTPFDEDLVATSLRYLNTPYLWGGKGILGIDCSGFTQIVAKVHGIALPRDASQQCEVGRHVPYDERKAGDLMYFVNSKGHVHHVGVLLNDHQIIHASGHVRIDTYSEKGVFRQDFDRLTHTFHSIKRIWIK